MLEKPELRQRPVNGILALRNQRNFAFVIDLPPVSLPTNLWIFVAAIVELKAIPVAQHRGIISLRARRIHRRRKLRRVQLERDALQIMDQPAIHKQFQPRTNVAHPIVLGAAAGSRYQKPCPYGGGQ